VSVRGLGTAAGRIERIAEISAFLDRQPAWAGARLAYLQGDASMRAYARLRDGDRTVLLMDAPRQPDGPPIRDGKSYSRIACLAEDMVRPFVAIGTVLRTAGLSAPNVLAADLDAGLALVEDLDDRLFGRQIAAGASQAELWRAAAAAGRDQLPPA
jgi:aminoglycoside/choline kinase family phosphotransferase